MVTWIGVVFVALILVVVIGVVVLLHSARFHHYLLTVAQTKATQAIGTQVQVGDFALHWSGMSPSVDIYNVVIHGAAPYENPPLLSVDHVGLGVTITSLLHKSWYVNNVAVDHPVVRVFEDKAGVDNLPKSQSSGNQQSSTNIFQLGIRHALLDRGEIYYNNRKAVLDADLHDLNFQSGFDSAQQRYAGTLAYRDGHLHFENFNPVPHDLNAQFSATPQTFTLQRAVLTSGHSQFTLTATVDNYTSPRVHATYDAVVDAGEVRHIIKNPSVPVGLLHANGTLQYVNDPNRPVMQTLSADGAISSRMLSLITPSFRGDIRNIGAHYTLTNGNALVRNIHAELLGGELTGTFLMRDIEGNSRSNLNAALRGVSLAQVKTLVNSPSMQQLRLTGTANAIADASWGKTFNDLVAHANATLQAGIGSAHSSQTVPVNGAVHGTYLMTRNEATLAQTFLRTPQTSVYLNGTVGNASALQVRLLSNNLHELETIADMFQTPPTSGQPAQPLGLYGTASFNGAVRGKTNAPQVTGQLEAANLRLRGTSWRRLSTRLALSPSLASVQNGVLQPADKGMVNFSASAGLRNWSFQQNSPFQVALNAQQINVADLAKAAGSQTAISGTLSANIAASGTELNPVGHGNITLATAKIGPEPLDRASLNFNGTGSQVAGNLQVRMRAGSANGTFTIFPRQKAYDAHLQATGIQLDKLQSLAQRNLQLKGVLNVTANGRGTFDNPGVQLMAQVPNLQVENQNIKGLTLQANVANHVGTFALDSQLLNTYARARGTVNLTGNYYTNATFDTQAIPLGPLVAIYAPSQAGDITGQTELHATVRGPLANKALLEAHVTVPQLALNYKNSVHLGAASPIHVDYVNGVLTLQRAAIRGTDTDLQFQGRIPLQTNAPASLLLVGTVNLQLAALINPDFVTSGQLRFNIDSYGERSNPNVQGQIQIVNADFASGDMPIGLQNGNGVLTLTKDRLNITSFTGVIGGGTVTASGGVVYRPQLVFDLGLAANNVRMLYPQGMRVALSTNMALTGTTTQSTLRGQIRITNLAFTPDFDLTNFMGQFSGTATPPPAQGFSNDLALDLGVTTTSGVNLTSRTLSIAGTANLHVVGTAAQPVVLGRVNLNGGDLIFNGNRYVLQGGTIQFINPNETQPVMDVSATTTIQQYDVLIHFWGPSDQLHTNYSSDPALPPADIINLIAFGKTSEASAANPTPPGSLGAESLIASQVSSQVTSRVEKIAGISQLSIDPELGGNGQNPGARITIQQRVTSKIFVTFGTDVTQTQNATVQLEYKASPHTSYNAVRDQNGGFAFDVRKRKSW